MSKLVWDKDGERVFETGTKNGVLYTLGDKPNASGSKYTIATAWNGLTGVTETPEGAEPTDLYADDTKYITLRSAEKLNATITAYTYPDEWGKCDGSDVPVAGVRLYQQARRTFGLCYRSSIGNDEDGQDHGYRLHLLYGCTASPSERAYKTINDSPEAIEFSWGITTTPISVTYDGKTYKPTALITVDSTDFEDETKKGYLAALEAKLFGTDSDNAYLPMPEEVLSILATGSYTPSSNGAAG